MIQDWTLPKGWW